MAYLTYSQKETENQKLRAKAQETLEMFNHPVPGPFMDEDRESYRKRLLPHVQQHAPNFQNVKVDEARGSVFDLLEKQVFDDAQKEARQPTMIPDGELREVVRHDHVGRPVYEYYGKCGAWLKDFSTGRKMLTNIRTETQRGFTNPNVSSIAGLKY